MVADSRNQFYFRLGTGIRRRQDVYLHYLCVPELIILNIFYKINEFV